MRIVAWNKPGPLLACLLLALAYGAAAGGGQAAGGRAVVTPQDDGSHVVQAPTYRAVIGADGNLHSFRVGDVEMIDDRTAISLGCFFYAGGARKLSSVSATGSRVLQATDSTYGARYRFLSDEIKIRLSNNSTRPVSYFVVLRPDLRAVTNTDSGEAAAVPANEQWGHVRLTAESGAFLELAGGSRVWGPWLGRQVWELSEVAPGGEVEVRLRGGRGDPPKPTLEQLIGVRARVTSEGGRVPQGKPVAVRVAVDNRSDRSLHGLLAVELSACRGDMAIYSTSPVELPAGQAADRVFQWKVKEPDFYTAHVTAFVGERHVGAARAAGGYRTEAILPKPSRPSDFSHFWDRLLAQVGRDGPPFRMVRDRRRSRSGVEVWVVRYQSIGGKTIYGWYLLPEGKGRLPAILYLSGYGARPIEPPLGLASHGYVVLAIDVRGNRVDRVRPKPFEDYCTEGIASPETYVYREIAGHALRALHFLRARDEVDAARVAVLGVSEGGGVGLMLGALSSDVRAVLADAPMLCDFPLSLRSAGWPYTEIARYTAQHPEQRAPVAKTLSYFDVVNFAPDVKCPALLSVGFLDPVSLPAGVYGAYNLLPGPKEIHGLPEAGHEGGGDELWSHKLQWLARTLGARPNP